MDYVAYHSAELMGQRLGSGPPYGMLCRKSVPNLMGKRVWIIESRGKKNKTYFLRQCFTVDNISEIDDDYFRFNYSDKEGIDFATEINLSNLPWFAAFLKSVANFSIGVTTIKSEYLDKIVALTNYELSPENSLADSDTKYSAEAYAAAFRQLQISPHHLRMLLAHYHAPKLTLTATQMAKAMGYQTFASSNLHYGRLGRAVGDTLGWNPLPSTLVYVLAEFEKPEREWLWIMRPAVAEALEKLGWVKGEHSEIPEEVDMTASLYEGAVRRIAINAYERNSAAREKCILHYGCRCTACGRTLAEIYGETAQGLIHVHHLRQLSEANSEYQVDPIQDLRPVCPTCHAVIHSRNPTFSIEDIQEMIKDNNNANKAASPDPEPPGGPVR
jgi:predicted HNH restriction endonuclease